MGGRWGLTWDHTEASGTVPHSPQQTKLHCTPVGRFLVCAHVICVVWELTKHLPVQWVSSSCDHMCQGHIVASWLSGPADCWHFPSLQYNCIEIYVKEGGELWVETPCAADFVPQPRAVGKGAPPSVVHLHPFSPAPPCSCFVCPCIATTTLVWCKHCNDLLHGVSVHV